MSHSAPSPEEQVVERSPWPRRLLLFSCGLASAGLILNLLQLLWGNPFLVTIFFVFGLAAYGAGMVCFLAATAWDLRIRKIL